MRFLKKIFFYLASIVVLILLYFNLLHWGSGWLGFFVFILFFILNSILWRKILGGAFDMKRRDFIVKLYALFCVFLILSFVSSIWVVWYKITPLIIWIIFLLSQVIGEGLLLITKKSHASRNFLLESIGCKYSLPKSVVIKKHVLYIISFIVLWVTGFLMLSRGRGTSVLMSPWQVINKYYILVFFFLTLVLFLICLSRHKVKLIVFFLIMHSVLLHMYLPASSNNPWGGDVWRHVAVENKLMQGEFHTPVLFGPEAKWREVINIELPEALLIPNKYFYGQLWGSSVLLSSVLGINLFFINIWLMPILWGVMISIIMFRIGRLLFGSWKSGLLLALFVSVLFPFQALGGLTLPVSLGYLTFFFVLMLWLQYLRDGNKMQRNIVFFFAFLMLFGYSLHFVLIWLVIGLSLLIQHFAREALPHKDIFQNNFLRTSLVSLGIGFLIILFPMLEYILGSSIFTKSIDLVSKTVQVVGQFSGWYFASAIRPHDILTGNIIFNHTPNYSFVSSIFMDFRWPVMVFFLLIYVTVFIGLFCRRKRKDSVAVKVIQYIFLSVVSGYFLSWFLMGGDHSLVRRLDAMIGFLLVIFSLFGIFIFFKKLKSVNLQKIVVLFLVFIFSWVTATTYASGPDMRVVSDSEYEVASYLWEQVRNESDEVCIVADTWILLILESLSSQKIVGGGFPIDSQFGQFERVELYNGIQKMEFENFIERSHIVSGKDKCYLVLPREGVNFDLEAYFDSQMNNSGKLIVDFVVWEEMSVVVEEDLKEIDF